jgi:hypothetical protein
MFDEEDFIEDDEVAMAVVDSDIDDIMCAEDDLLGDGSISDSDAIDIVMDEEDTMDLVEDI